MPNRRVSVSPSSPGRQETPLITDQAALNALCGEWRRQGIFAFDTEFIRDDTYDAILCLVQVCDGERVTLIDPTAGLDIAPFWELVTDPAVKTIVHAGKEDFEVCLRQTGHPPRNLFDVQIAAGFVGHGYPLSLSRLVEAVLQKRLTKSQTLTDWSRRPLTADQLRYAVDDVAHLPALHQHLRARIGELGRTAWADEEMKRLEDESHYRPPVQERALKLKGTKKLDSLGLAVLQRLLTWRDRWARERNRPARALMRDDVLVEIAHRRPKRATDLEVLRGFPQSRNRAIVNELLELIREAVATPREDRPSPAKPQDDSPMTRAALDLLSAVMRAICFEENLSHELVGSSQRLRELLEHLKGERRERPPILTGWRGEFIGERLTAVLRGRSEIRLSGWPEQPWLEVVTHVATAKRA